MAMPEEAFEKRADRMRENDEATEQGNMRKE